MADEETPRVIDEKLVEIGGDRLVDTEAAGDMGDELGKRLLPLAPADPGLAGTDLPGSSDIADRPASPRPVHRAPPRR
jgi:hypothetical protein